MRTFDLLFRKNHSLPPCAINCYELRLLMFRNHVVKTHTEILCDYHQDIKPWYNLTPSPSGYTVLCNLQIYLQRLDRNVCFSAQFLYILVDGSAYCTKFLFLFRNFQEIFSPFRLTFQAYMLRLRQEVDKITPSVIWGLRYSVDSTPSVYRNPLWLSSIFLEDF